ncbi:alanine racemase [Fangia hongkongensis]|nr:alanine racemase [Fangia hongkongensis]
MTHFDHENLRAYAYIEKDNLLHNLTQIKMLHPNKKTIVMLKANGYGHGAVEIAKLLDGRCDYFGVASIEEGVELRENGIYQTQIIIFSGFFCAQSSDILIQFQLIPIIHSVYQCAFLTKYFQKSFSEIWLKVNSGMNRLGLNFEEFNLCYEELSTNTDKSINVLTHLAESESPDRSFTLHQIEAFIKLIQSKSIKHISIFNSGATIAYPEDTLSDTIRFGIALYGINPTPLKRTITLKPVMSLHSHVIAIQQVDKGQSIGYNRCFITKRPSTIAIVSIGYGDGYPQTIQNGTPVMIEGEIYPTVGKVSMDLMAVDITDSLNKVSIGSIVTLFGENLPIDTVIQQQDISAYSLLTGISPRVKRIYI